MEKIINTLVKATYNLTDNQTISLSYDKLTDEGDYLPRPNFSSKANEALNGEKLIFDTKFTRETITLKHKLDLGNNLRLNTSIYSNKNEIRKR